MFVKFPEAREKGERGRNGQWSGELGRDGVEMLERLKMLEQTLTLKANFKLVFDGKLLTVLLHALEKKEKK